MAPNAVLDMLVTLAEGKISDPKAQITGLDPVLPTTFSLGEFASGVHAACGMAAATIWEQKTGQAQVVGVNFRAAAASLQSYAYLRVQGPAPQPRPQISKFYECRDQRWFFVHGGFPHLLQGAMDLLSCEPTTEAVAKAVKTWDGQELEDAFAKAGLCGAMVRSKKEWKAQRQRQAIQDLPVVEILKIGDGPPRPWPKGNRPLSQIRVLDLTRVLAGPTCARTLAEHGADVLRIGSANLPSVPFFVMDTGHGKRTAFLDLKTKEDARTLRTLISKADVFSQGYRPGAMARLGFSPEDLARAHPGIVYVSMNCYGHGGPWAERPGWEQLAQTVTGVAHEEGGDSAPRLLPAAASDYFTGYAAAYGVLLALLRRADEGGSYHVRTSLCRSAMFLSDMARTERAEAAKQGPLALNSDEDKKFFIKSETGYGSMRYLGPVVQLSETPAQWDKPSVPLGTHKPEWLKPDEQQTDGQP